MPAQTIIPSKSGFLRVVDGDAWSDVRDIDTAETVTLDGNLFTEGFKHASTVWIISRTFFTFAIPSNIIITSASLQCYTLLYQQPARIIAGTRTDPENDITVEDYDQIDFTSAYSDAVSGINPNFTINSTGINYLNSKTGTNAELVAVQETDYSDTEPDADSYRAIWYGSHNASYYPRLTINYYGFNKKILAGTVHIGSNANIHI